MFVLLIYNCVVYVIFVVWFFFFFKQKTAYEIMPSLVGSEMCIRDRCKILKGCKKEQFLNSFLNLSISLLTQSEPLDSPQFKINPQLKATIWDRWELQVSNTLTLKKLFSILQQRYQIYPNDVAVGMNSIYVYDLINIPIKAEENQRILNQKMIEMLEFQDPFTNYVDITVTFTKENPQELLNQKINKQKGQNQQDIQKQYIKGIPKIRLIFE
eukprot:TRINITY_DN9044_c0_g1_i1.p1 TRINITY_DN9044_c0_g1~~TRINITY_DN9044_c0_g1_i1.p1  ORF type:complete len:213 (+),score=40.87 TRINITY_DN9044_c0_g1_i1:1-639(+)